MLALTKIKSKYCCYALYMPHHIPIVRSSSIRNIIMHTLRSDCQELTLSPLLTPTVDTYCNVVFIVCLKASQFILCDTDTVDVQKSSIWGLRSIGGNVDEVETNTLSITHRPVHSYIHSSTDIFREDDTGEDGD